MLRTGIRRVAAALPAAASDAATYLLPIALRQPSATTVPLRAIPRLTTPSISVSIASWVRYASGEAGPGPQSDRPAESAPSDTGSGDGARDGRRGNYYGAEFLKETTEYHDPKSTAGQTTWNLIWEGEVNGEEGQEGLDVWECDFTGGAIPNNEVNALLSNRAKWDMYNLHTDNAEEFSVEHLAKKFRIRPQRVMAIIALKEMETKAIEEGKITRQESDAINEGIDKELGANYGEGTGERAYPHVATYPKFEYVTPEEAAQQPDDGIDPVEALREKLAAKHEVGAIQEFKDRLDFAMGRVGSSLKRGRRKRREIHAGTGKSTILIKPLGRDQKYEPWVATPDGSTRTITEDEELLLKRKTPKPRKKSLW